MSLSSEAVAAEKRRREPLVNLFERPEEDGEAVSKKEKYLQNNCNLVLVVWDNGI